MVSPRRNAETFKYTDGESLKNTDGGSMQLHSYMPMKEAWDVAVKLGRQLAGIVAME